MNRLAKKTVGIVRSRISNEVEGKHRSFNEMIQWRKEKDKKDRLVRNKVSVHSFLCGVMSKIAVFRNLWMS